MWINMVLRSKQAILFAGCAIQASDFPFMRMHTGKTAQSWVRWCFPLCVRKAPALLGLVRWIRSLWIKKVGMRRKSFAEGYVPDVCWEHPPDARQRAASQWDCGKHFISSCLATKTPIALTTHEKCRARPLCFLLLEKSWIAADWVYLHN